MNVERVEVFEVGDGPGKGRRSVQDSRVIDDYLI